jgi:hypothetical protein
MIAWIDDIQKVTLDNSSFRTVVSGEHEQLTVRRLGQGEDIGWEAHTHLDQFLRR